MSLDYEIGYRCLGPVFRFFCYRLRLIEQFKKGTPLLFLSRGGIRLRYFYHSYLDTNNLPRLTPVHDCYVSRILTLTALLSQHSDYAVEEIAKEFYGVSDWEAMRSFLPESQYQNWTSDNTKITPAYLRSLLVGQSKNSHILKRHAQEQNELLKQHISELIDASNEAILVDTGWSGSIVKSLQDLLPQVAFTGAFFGRYNYGKPPLPWFNSITGLVFQSDGYHTMMPNTSIVFHRHLIESLCEPLWPSVKYLQRINEEIVPNAQRIPETVLKPGLEEDIARAVGDYLLNEPASNVEKIVGEYQMAMKELAGYLKYPSVKTARALAGPARSADFGREFSVPVLLEPESGTSKKYRLKHSLWRQGQAAIEYQWLRWPVQFLITYRMLFPRLVNFFKRVVRRW